ncbi:MAG: ammonium transporter [Verrucomicrobiota bacterium]
MNTPISLLLKLLGITFFICATQSGLLAISDPIIPTEKTYKEWQDSLSGEKSFFTVSNLWLLVSAALVFMMHLGFASLESGLTQSKNTVNIIYKNVFIISIGLITYAIWGYVAMYPAENFNGFFHPGGWLGIDPDKNIEVMTTKSGVYYAYWTDFIFQAMFAATAASIISGAVAERIKLTSFMLFAALIVMFGYPMAGSWTWGSGGWLAEKGFTDFAGSSIVHAFGGYAALAAILILGPRHGKYGTDGKITKPILGHSMPLAAVGVFLLWFGWFGFNGGSVLSADPELVGRVFVTTALSAAAGAIGCMITTVIVMKKPDLSMALNGVLAGLVGITAGADSIEPSMSLLVGFISGIIVVISILLFDRLRIDDPVGAVSVHGICGSWGTLAVGIFGPSDFLWQLVGCLSYGIFAFVVAFILFYIIKLVIGVRVSEEEEIEGLDIAEHGQEAYPEFQSR